MAIFPDFQYSIYADKVGRWHSIANSSLFPTFMYLHSNSTQILALKKTGFFTFSDSKKIFQNFFYKIIMQLFSADAIVFSKKF